MQEWCACGGSIKGRRRDVLAWRKSHGCVRETPEPDKQGSDSRVEHAGTRSVDVDTLGAEAPVIYARMGFTPND